MLIRPTADVGRHPGIECAVRSVGHDVDPAPAHCSPSKAMFRLPVCTVMAGLVPAIHAAPPSRPRRLKAAQCRRRLRCCTTAWMAGSSPAMTGEMRPALTRPDPRPARYSAQLDGFGIGNASSRNPSRWNSIASRISAFTSSTCRRPRRSRANPERKPSSSVALLDHDGVTHGVNPGGRRAEGCSSTRPDVNRTLSLSAGDAALVDPAHAGIARGRLEKKEAAICVGLLSNPLANPERWGTLHSARESENTRSRGCSGIAGLEFGLNETGHETVLLSEIWVPAAAVL